jgi:hypothetical protein
MPRRLLSDNYIGRLTTITSTHFLDVRLPMREVPALISGEGERVITTDAQVRKLMKEMGKGETLEVAALRAGMGRKAAGKYVALGKLPSELKGPRTWRTREDPFATDWPGVMAMLTEAPELEAKALFEDLIARRPGVYELGQVRTFQRRVGQWRAESGPPKEVFFSQEHRPGEAMQTDFTWGTELEVTIGGEPFKHTLCHCVLPYSNWQWATVCQSESMAAIKRGMQAALFRLGRRPTWSQTDHSTAATHDLANGKRGFNAEYEAFVTHFGMKPRTIGIGKSEQNGDVEAANGALKRRLTQHLLLRGSRDFESVEAYETWVQGALEKANALRGERLCEELSAMEPMTATRVPEYTTEDAVVSTWSTIRVKANSYSVPSRLIGETVRVRIYDDRLEVSYAGKPQLSVERLHGRTGHRINYRHIIWSLVKKPGAFARYRYREDLFPSVVFRKAYDAVQAARPGTRGDLEYLRVLHQAASTLESEVETALGLLLDAGVVPFADAVKALVSPAMAEIPEMAVPTVDLAVYDALLVERREEVA